MSGPRDLKTGRPMRPVCDTGDQTISTLQNLNEQKMGHHCIIFNCGLSHLGGLEKYKKSFIRVRALTRMKCGPRASEFHVIEPTSHTGYSELVTQGFRG